MGSGLGTSEVSVIIPTNDNRKEELKKVIEYLKGFGFEDIIIARGERRMMNRYDAVKQAKNDIIYTQDDDCLIHNIPMLLEAYRKDRVIANIKLGHLQQYSQIGDGKIFLVGWGAIFHKDAVNFERYLTKYPEDDITLREADRLFTWLNDVEVMVADGYIEDFPSAWNGMGLERNHYPSLFEMADRVKTL